MCLGRYPDMAELGCRCYCCMDYKGNLSQGLCFCVKANRSVTVRMTGYLLDLCGNLTICRSSCGVIDVDASLGDSRMPPLSLRLK